MSIDLESLKEGYNLRARICELEGSCSPYAIDRLFRSLERNLASLSRNPRSVSSLEIGLKQTTKVIDLFLEVDQSVSRIRGFGYEEIFSKDLAGVKKMRDDFYKELKRIYSAGEGIISPVDKDGVIKSFVYSARD